MAVSVYDDSTNGVSLWGPSSFTDVPVVDGFFNVVLPNLDDSGTNSLAGIGSGSAFVEVIADGVTNGARQQILAVPRSLDGTPPGVVDAFAGDTNAIPAGWLLCDGSEVSIERYRALYSVISTNWGGDGVTSFNVPDLGGRFLRCVDYSGESRDPDGVRSVGSDQADAFQGHRHGIGHGGGDTYDFGGRYYSSNSQITRPSTGDPIADAVNGEPRVSRETRPKNMAVNYIIKY